MNRLSASLHKRVTITCKECGAVVNETHTDVQTDREITVINNLASNEAAEQRDETAGEEKREEQASKPGANFLRARKST